MFENQKHAHDNKSGLGFVNGCYSVPYSSNVKTCFKKKVMVSTPSIDKGKKVIVYENKVASPSKIQPSQMFVPSYLPSL